MPVSRAFLEDLADRLESGDVRGKAALHRVKVGQARAEGGGPVPSDAELLEAAAAVDPALRSRLLPFVRTKPVRTLSGVAVVAVMTSPAACPHGRCTFCPGGVAAGSPQAYTGFEPAALRGARAGFDAREQVAGRLAQLAALGHDTDKVDLVVMGGTFPARPGSYQEDFVKGALDAMNGVRAATLAEACARNEVAASRCVGLTVETKPDWCGPREVSRMLAYGTTRVEVGVQALDDGVLEATARGHTVADVVAATRHAKDAGLKLCYHLMPGMPGMDPAKDRAGFRRLFEDGAFRPDQLKVYPTLVLPHTPLFDAWRRGEYEPYDDATAAAVVADLKEVVPPYVRVQRVERDIPTPVIAAGPRHSNLRQLARAALAARGGRCVCIRCREAGHRANAGEAVDLSGPLREGRTNYRSAGGEEVFLELTDGVGALHAFARVRRAGSDGAAGSRAGDAFLRELRVVGRVAELDGGGAPPEAARLQHRGLGARLLGDAERTAFEEWAAPVLRVTAGVGVRGYYRRLGYALEGPYMVKARRAG
ncbi:MAG TPA: elongator complex protein 3 [Candidatus Thermoplasmatota archaeon]